MTVGLLLITHDRIGEALLAAATGVLGTQSLPAAAVSVYNDSEPDTVAAEAEFRMSDLHADDGVLVLTDLFGSTPSNIACRLQRSQKVMVVTGVNLPMLVRVMNYPRLSLEQLAMKAASGGSDGVFQCHLQQAPES